VVPTCVNVPSTSEAVERNPVQQAANSGNGAPRLAGERERELLIEVENGISGRVEAR